MSAHAENQASLKGYVIVFLAIVLLTPFALNLADDVITFHRIVDGDYKTPWFENSWVKQPYTMTRLAMHESAERTTTNAIKSKVLRIKEVVIGDVVFWTVIDAIEVGDDIVVEKREEISPSSGG